MFSSLWEEKGLPQLQPTAVPRLPPPPPARTASDPPPPFPPSSPPPAQKNPIFFRILDHARFDSVAGFRWKDCRFDGDGGLLNQKFWAGVRGGRDGEFGSGRRGWGFGAWRGGCGADGFRGRGGDVPRPGFVEEHAVEYRSVGGCDRAVLRTAEVSGQDQEPLRRGGRPVVFLQGPLCGKWWVSLPPKLPFLKTLHVIHVQN